MSPEANLVENHRTDTFWFLLVAVHRHAGEAPLSTHNFYLESGETQANFGPQAESVKSDTSVREVSQNTFPERN